MLIIPKKNGTTFQRTKPFPIDWLHNEPAYLMVPVERLVLGDNMSVYNLRQISRVRDNQKTVDCCSSV